MGRVTSGKLSIKGTRGNDTISVGEAGVTVNGSFKPLTAAQIDAGLIIAGEAGNDVLSGGRGPDEIKGGAGNDRIEGGASLDRLIGGDGDDWFTDSDVLIADTNPDDKFDPNANNGAIFDGGRGFDTLDFSNSPVPICYYPGGFGSNFSYDTVDGHPVGANGTRFDLTDRVFGIEQVYGSAGNDILFGAGFQAQTLHGGGGDDYIVGSTQNDRLFGNDGDDVIVGNRGDDEMTGGAGRDVFIFGDFGSDHHDGHDVIFGFSAGDLLAFQAGEAPPAQWSPTIYNGVQSLVGTYDGGLSSITLVGVTSLPSGAVEATEDWW